MMSEEIQHEYDAIVETQCQVVKTGMELQVVLLDLKNGSCGVEAVMVAQCSYVQNVRRLYTQAMALKEKAHGRYAEIDEALEDFETFCNGFVEHLASSYGERGQRRGPIRRTRVGARGSWTLYTKPLTT
jgi:hypothetical protein